MTALDGFDLDCDGVDVLRRSRLRFFRLRGSSVFLASALVSIGVGEKVAPILPCALSSSRHNRTRSNPRQISTHLDGRLQLLPRALFRVLLRARRSSYQGLAEGG